MTDQADDRPPAPGDDAARELRLVRDLARILVADDRPEDVLRRALERVSREVETSFASLFLMRPDEEEMRLAAEVNWPAPYRQYLSGMRMRVGSGASGRAAESREPVVVQDALDGPDGDEWREIAQELGFRSLCALPLVCRGHVFGVATCYFEGAGAITAGRERLLRAAADPMAVAAEKVMLVEELRRTVALREGGGDVAVHQAESVDTRQLKDEFLSNMSHELRTPLTSVLGYCYLLQEGLTGPLSDEQRTTLSQVTASSERLLSLVEDLLELAALKRGDYRIVPESFDLRDAVQGAVAAVHDAPAAVSLQVELPDAPVDVRTDRGKVTKLVVNLLQNAYKFTHRGEVVVGVRRNGTHAEVHVRDTGIGIPPEARTMVFDAFRQVDGSPTRRYAGSGIGLALARTLARLLGGDIELTSREGEGSEFTVHLPLHYAPHAPGDNLHPAAANPKPSEET